MVPFCNEGIHLEFPNFFMVNFYYMLTTFCPSISCIIETIPIKFVIKTTRFMIDTFSEFLLLNLNIYKKTKKQEHLS